MQCGRTTVVQKCQLQRVVAGRFGQIQPLVRFVDGLRVVAGVAQRVYQRRQRDEHFPVVAEQATALRNACFQHGDGLVELALGTQQARLHDAAFAQGQTVALGIGQPPRLRGIEHFARTAGVAAREIDLRQVVAGACQHVGIGFDAWPLDQSFQQRCRTFQIAELHV